MSRVNDSVYEKEMEAQKKRVQALQYLETNGCGPTRFEQSLTTKGVTQAMAEKKNTKAYSTDNTLEQVRKQSGNSSGLKTALLEFQSAIPPRKAPLPSNWEAVVDPTTGKTYYWNKSTNVTSWERPNPDSASTYEGDLPPGWIKVIHSATQQEYYIHQATNEKRWTRPTDSHSTSDIPVPSRGGQNANGEGGGGGSGSGSATDRKKPRESEAQLQEKRRRLQIDPLDPTGGMGTWLAGATADGKMADSTATGPLWQQRPYPAPGQALKKEKKPGEDVGPALPSRR